MSVPLYLVFRSRRKLNHTLSVPCVQYSRHHGSCTCSMSRQASQPMSASVPMNRSQRSRRQTGVHSLTSAPGPSLCASQNHIPADAGILSCQAGSPYQSHITTRCQDPTLRPRISFCGSGCPTSFNPLSRPSSSQVTSPRHVPRGKHNVSVWKCIREQLRKAWSSRPYGNALMVRDQLEPDDLFKTRGTSQNTISLITK